MKEEIPSSVSEEGIEMGFSIMRNIVYTTGFVEELFYFTPHPNPLPAGEGTWLPELLNQ